LRASGHPPTGIIFEFLIGALALMLAVWASARWWLLRRAL